MTILMKVIAFLLSVGPLIILHELGHYFAARACGVKVLRFSFFWGKVLWSRKFGRDQTEWAISALPLGGYVKMLDDRNPDTAATTDADKKREFTRQNVWKRIAIIGAGPLANFVVAIILFAGLFMVGMPELSTRLRPMAADTPAYVAGLRGGETVTAVNGEPVQAWGEVRMELSRAVLAKEQVQLDVRQERGARLSVVLPAETISALKIDSDVTGALGLSADPGPAVLEQVLPEGAAARAGLRAGDIVTAIDDKPTRDGIAVIETIRASQGKPLQVTLLRDGAAQTLTVTPDIDAATKAARINAKLSFKPEQIVVSAGPLEAIAKGANATWNQVTLIVTSIAKMFTGEVSIKNLSGPITIADYAEQSANQGLIVFLTFVASISIGMGVMNLLPIPVLDGGHLLYYSLEVLTGRPLPARVEQYVQQFGFVLFIMLMSLALFNDVARQLS